MRYFASFEVAQLGLRSLDRCLLGGDFLLNPRPVAGDGRELLLELATAGVAILHHEQLGQYGVRHGQVHAAHPRRFNARLRPS